MLRAQGRTLRFYWVVLRMAHATPLVLICGGPAQAGAQATDRIEILTYPIGLARLQEADERMQIREYPYSLVFLDKCVGDSRARWLPRLAMTTNA